MSDYERLPANLKPAYAAVQVGYSRPRYEALQAVLEFNAAIVELITGAHEHTCPLLDDGKPRCGRDCARCIREHALAAITKEEITASAVEQEEAQCV